MKKIIILSVAALFMSITTTAQQRPGDRIQKLRIERGFQKGEINRAERFHIRKDQLRYKIAQRRALRDGRITPMERRKLMMMKRHNRQDMFRFKHNRFRRVI